MLVNVKTNVAIIGIAVSRMKPTIHGEMKIEPHSASRRARVSRGWLALSCSPGDSSSTIAIRRSVGGGGARPPRTAGGPRSLYSAESKIACSSSTKSSMAASMSRLSSLRIVSPKVTIDANASW